MQKVIEILEGINSTYVPSFLTLCEQVSVAMTEANDNVKYLTALASQLEKPVRFCMCAAIFPRRPASNIRDGAAARRFAP